MSTATYLSTDTTTQGTWIGKYGADGYYYIENGSTIHSSLPSYISGVSIVGPLNNWSDPTADVRGLQYPNGSARSAACWYDSGSGLNFTITATDTKQHVVSFYLLDWDTGVRVETLTIKTSSSGTTLDSRSSGIFTNGKWFRYQFSGSIYLTIAQTGTSNSVVSGLFFDTPPVLGSMFF